MYTPLGPPGSYQPLEPPGGRRCRCWLVTPLIFVSNFLGLQVEETFLHKAAKFYVKTIMRSKVKKVYIKSLKNATEQPDKVIQASLNACIEFKCLFNRSYFY